MDTADEMNINLPATKVARDLYEKMTDELHLGDLGTQGLLKVYEPDNIWAQNGAGTKFLVLSQPLSIRSIIFADFCVLFCFGWQKPG